MAGQIVSLTPAALSRVRELLAREQGRYPGLRLGISTKGCSGLTYEFAYAKEVTPADQVHDAGDVRLYIDTEAAGYLGGTEIDYVEDKLGAQFVFHNPNEKGRCGCGESFTV